MRILIILLILISINIQSQNLPEFTSNASDNDKANSLVFQAFNNKYDMVISYTRSCYWPTEQWYFVLVNKNNKWEFFKWIIKFNGRTKDKENIISTKIKNQSLKNEEIDSLFNFWTINSFLELSIDSINCSSKVENDSMIIDMQVTDGCSDVFEIFSKDKYRMVYSYMPDYYQKEIPILQRQDFILCRIMFFKLLEIK